MDIKEVLSTPQKIVITTHKGPDGDAIGSSLALFHYLERKGHHVVCVVPDHFPDFLKWMESSETILVHETQEKWSTLAIKDADLIFCLDYNDLSRVGGLGELIEKSDGYKAMIDHHLNPSDFADWMMSDTSSCSTAQLIYDFIEDCGDVDLIDPTIGEGIYCGIMTDSGSFRFPSVQARTHEIAAALIEKGLKHSHIHESVYDSNRLDRLKLLGYVLNNKLEVLPNGMVALIHLSKAEQDEFGVEKGDTEGLVNYALSIVGVRMSVFVKEAEDMIKMSFRSKGDIAVNEFAGEYYSGGGHKNAAGGKSDDSLEKTLNDLRERLIDFVK